MKKFTSSLSDPSEKSTVNKRWFGLKTLLFVLFFALSNITIFGQFSAPNFTPPPEKKTPKPSLEVQVSQQQAPMSLIKKEISLPQIKEIRLREMTQSEREPQPNKKRFRIGAVRQLPNAAQKIADYSRLEVNVRSAVFTPYCQPASNIVAATFFRFVAAGRSSRLCLLSCEPTKFCRPIHCTNR